MKTLSQESLQKVKAWLTDLGIEHFKNLKEKYGEVCCVYSDGGIPHPVHLREGMEVRNFLRTLSECYDWTDYDFDDNWDKIIDTILQMEK